MNSTTSAERPASVERHVAPEFFTHIERMIDRGSSWQAINQLVLHLSTQRANLLGERWKSYVASHIRLSKLERFAHRCPFTKRCFDKPRGYAGDPVTMDMIYGTGGVVASDLEDEEIFRYTTSSPATRAVRYRRKLIARYIDEACTGNAGARILSLACGHAREIELSEEMKEGKLREFVAFDQDREGLAVVGDTYGHLGVTAHAGSIGHYIAGRTAFDNDSFDLVYTVGLLDYLPKYAAERFAVRAFKNAAPGGTLLLASFLPGIRDAGYMEAITDWWLTYRSDADMIALLGEIDSTRYEGLKVWHDPDDNIVFLKLRKIR